MCPVKYRNDYGALNILVITDSPSPQSGPKSLTEFRHEMGFPSKLQKKKICLRLLSMLKSLNPSYNYRLLNVNCEIFGTSSYGEGRTSASPPYERVPNISQYTFNNLFIIYL